jgi:DNA-directed RNA polymerase specialized sigma24 family protein
VELTPSSSSPVNFIATHWTLVLQARGESAAAKAALSSLCEAYWQPIFHFLRREGRTEDEARELAQEFFARILAGDGLRTADPARGRFRSFLLGALRHFLADARDHRHRLKRGGGLTPESLDAPPAHSDTTSTTAGLQVPDPAAVVPDEVFDREWAFTIMANALAAVQRELAADGKAAQFDVLKPWLAGDSTGCSSVEAAARLGISEGALKVAIHRLRKRFRELVKSEIARTVTDPSLVANELRYLVDILARG